MILLSFAICIIEVHCLRIPTAILTLAIHSYVAFYFLLCQFYAIRRTLSKKIKHRMMTLLQLLNRWCLRYIVAVENYCSKIITRKPKMTIFFTQHLVMLWITGSLTNLQPVWVVNSEQKIQILSLGYLGTDVISDVINCEIEGFHQNCAANHFCTFLLSFAIWNLIRSYTILGSFLYTCTSYILPMPIILTINLTIF